jgi:hypothetical protein
LDFPDYRRVSLLLASVIMAKSAAEYNATSGFWPEGASIIAGCQEAGSNRMPASYKNFSPKPNRTTAQILLMFTGR